MYPIISTSLIANWLREKKEESMIEDSNLENSIDNKKLYKKLNFFLYISTKA
jgi:hypothetical protein